ncbi:transposase [Nonomuraea basaltis]|uniref:transposase n=1 Tax=Nonomuraea basaltis TaxID=2495887 RepID=UPI00110C4A6F|nr:transposase [Nonomuraea basaltis]TMR98812.1 transposase [Nonomuraea basaltis]
MRRKPPLAPGETTQTACARALLRGGVDELSGELLSPGVLAMRVGWCAELVSGITQALLAEHWNSADVAQLASGVDAGGQRLPSQAWMALRRLGWTAGPPQGVRVSDRIVRMAQEQAGRLLRSAQWRAELTAGVLTTWPADASKRTTEEWQQVRAALPDGRHLPSSVIRARTRQIAAYAQATRRLPADVFELEGAPRAARMLLLAACDRQQATLERSDTDPRQVLLRLQLPTRADPRAYADWTWVACPITLPAIVPTSAVLHLPTLCLQGQSVRAEVAFTHAVPQTRRSGHTVALGVDWGLNTLLSAGAARLHPDGRITTLGAGARFHAAGVLAKQHRLRRLSERLHAKTDQYQRLADQDAPHTELSGKHDVLRREIGHVSARRSHLNDALAWAAARWAVDQAIAARASVIYLEDLRSLEATGMGRTLNTRLSQTVRGQIADHIRHLAAQTGIAVVTVPAKNTSRHCPHCLCPLRHRKAPDRPTTPGWAWALCPNPGCSWQGDRDQGAWRRIAARGLAHQTKTVVDRGTGQMTIHNVVDTLEARAVIPPAAAMTSRADRSKTGPTRRRTTRPAPRRRGAPSPARPVGRAGQRPEGHAPTGRDRLPRAAHRHQGVTTISTPTRRRHRPRGAALGAGFHLHAHTTPPRWAPPMPDATTDMGSLS